MTLPDDVIVYPNHGAGSACGKNMSKETWDTLGNQKKVNYALRSDMTKAEFIEAVTTGLVAPPQYFPKNAVMNKMGYDSIDQVMERGMNALSPKAFKAAMDTENSLILDTRPKDQFPQGYIANSLYIGVDETFAPWVGALITDLNTPILIVAEPGKEAEVITRLSRVGYDNPIGFLDGGIVSWKNAGYPIESLDEVNADQLASLYQLNKINVLDVRKQSEYDAEHVVGFENYPLDSLNANYQSLDASKTYYVHCAGGYRSVIACSLLRRKGVKNVINVIGGFKAIKETSLPISDFVEPSTML
jgi:rhodanese-related sulfurtransferase